MGRIADALRRAGPLTIAIWIATAIALLWAIARTLGLERGFPLTPLIAYTPYAAVAAGITLAVAALTRRWLALAVSVLSVALFVAAIVPRISGSTRTAGRGAITVRILSANVYRGAADMRAVALEARRRDADLLAVEELTPEADAELRALGLRRRLPHAVINTSPDVRGGGIYSRFRLQRRSGPATTFKSPAAAFSVPGASLPIELIAVHTTPPIESLFDTWKSGLQALPDGGQGRILQIIAGDFNATFDHVEFRRVVARGYRDAGEQTGRGLRGTWGFDGTFSIPVTIDHVLADERIRVLDYDVIDLPGSDHRMVFAALELPRG